MAGQSRWHYCGFAVLKGALTNMLLFFDHQLFYANKSKAIDCWNSELFSNWMFGVCFYLYQKYKNCWSLNCQLGNLMACKRNVANNLWFQTGKDKHTSRRNASCSVGVWMAWGMKTSSPLENWERLVNGQLNICNDTKLTVMVKNISVLPMNVSCPSVLFECVESTISKLFFSTALWTQIAMSVHAWKTIVLLGIAKIMLLRGIESCLQKNVTLPATTKATDHDEKVQTFHYNKLSSNKAKWERLCHEFVNSKENSKASGVTRSLSQGAIVAEGGPMATVWVCDK